MKPLASKMTKEDVLVFEIELTGACNLECVLCARKFKPMQDKMKKKQRPLEDIVRQLDEFPNLKECCIAGHISEPTLYRHLFKLLDYLNRRNIKIEFFTNSELHRTGYWKELSRHFKPQDQVFFTVCGSTQEIHEKYRVGSNLKKVIENALAFKDACPYKIDYIQHIMFEYNKEDFNTTEMQTIMNMFNNRYLINSLQYNDRFGIVAENSDIQMTKDLRNKYVSITNIGRKRINHNSVILCKSLQEKFIDIDQFGNIHPCFLHRMNVPGKFNIENYDSILAGAYDFCFECEKGSIELLKIFGLERIG